MSASGQQRRRLTKGNGDTLAPSWSPDGKQIAFVDRVTPHGSNYALYVIGRNGKGLKRIVGGARYQNNPTWSPSGKLINCPNGQYVVDGEAERQGSETAGRRDVSVLVAGRQERCLFAQRRSLEMKAGGAGAHKIADVPSSTAGIAWSPDGRLDRLCDRGTAATSRWSIRTELRDAAHRRG